MPLTFKYLNGNPWQREDIPDCTLRACSLALNYSYIELCKIFGVKCTLGRGLAKTEESAGYISDVVWAGSTKGFFRTWEMDYILDDYSNNGWKETNKDTFVDSEAGLTIGEQISILPNGRYLFFVRPRRNSANESWHCTYVNRTKMVYMDTYPCATPKTVVYGYVQINPEAILKPEDPKSRKSELEQINKGKLWGQSCPLYCKPEKWKEWRDSGKIPENLVGRIAYLNMKNAGYR